MLAMLVTSKVRRLLLELLWRHGTAGTASELAKRGKISFAAAYRELKRLLAFGLVTRTVVDQRDVYQAATEHPDADLLRRLVAAPRTARAPDGPADDTTRRRARTLGAPLALAGEPVPEGQREQAVVDAVQLARRDATLAKVLPIMLWHQRGALDLDRLAARASHANASHVLGFIAAVTAHLSGDRALATWAEGLRDHRARGQRAFFELPASSPLRAASTNMPARVRRWGFTQDFHFDEARATFDKFHRAARA